MKLDFLPPNGTPVDVNNRHCDRIIRDVLGLVISTEIFVCSPGNNELTYISSRSCKRSPLTKRNEQLLGHRSVPNRKELTHSKFIQKTSYRNSRHAKF
jgi:hypothetical protein